MGKEFNAEYQPTEERKARGRSFKNKLLDTIKEESLLDVETGASKETVERAFIMHIAKRAFDKDDNNSSTILKELISKTYPTLKAALPEYPFKLEDDATPAEKAEAVFNAIASGSIPPDVGSMLIQAAKNMVDIEIGTEIKERVAKLEELVKSSEA